MDVINIEPEESQQSRLRSNSITQSTCTQEAKELQIIHRPTHQTETAAFLNEPHYASHSIISLHTDYPEPPSQTTPPATIKHNFLQKKYGVEPSSTASENQTPSHQPEGSHITPVTTRHQHQHQHQHQQPSMSSLDLRLSSSNWQQAPRRPSTRESVRLATHLWLRIVRKSAGILIGVAVFLCAYYLPAKAMSREALDESSAAVYGRARGYIRGGSYYLAMGLIFVHLFSLRCSRKAILCVIVPCMAVDAAVSVFGDGAVMWVNMVTNITTFLSGTLSFYFVKAHRQMVFATPKQEMLYGLTKDGTPYALLRGLVGLYVIVGFFLQKFLPFLITCAFAVQVFCRLVLFPLLFFVSKSYQTFVIFGLSDSLMDRRLIINCISSLYIKFMGRIVLSSLSSNGSNVMQYVIINLLITAINVVTVVSFKRRITLTYDLLDWIWSLIPSRIGPTRVVSIAPDPDHHTHSAKKKEHLRKSMLIRSLTLYEEIGHEMVVIVIAPLLMYFLYPIYPETTFHTISSIRQCFVQIIIQIIIVFVGDVASLAHEIRHGNILYDPQHTPVEFKHRVVSICFSVFCISYAQFCVAL